MPHSAPDVVDDARYRAHYFAGDVAQCRFALLVLLAPMAPFLYFDYLLLGISPVFYQLAVARTAMAVLTLWLWHDLRRLTDARSLDLRMVLWALAGAALSLGNNFTRPPEYFGHYITDVWLIMMFYAGVPLPPRVQAIPVLLYAGLSLLVLFAFKRPPLPLYAYTVVLMLFLSVWCGHLISTRIHRYRRDVLVAHLELERQARTDPLTGAFNRREFLRVAEEELVRHARVGKPISVLMLDLDNFKSINDRYGHATGDRVLIEFTDRAGATLRAYDRLARTGGEEFSVLLPEATEEEALAIAERMRNAIAATPFVERDHAIAVTTSVGVATVQPGEVKIDEVMQRADKALYAAKDSGRNCIEVAPT